MMFVLPPVYLASKSPRRRHLLEACHIPFTIIDAEIDETDYPDDLPATEIAEYLAIRKAEKGLLQLDDGLVIAADSLVLCNDQVLGKPASRDEAKHMLALLSDARHMVVSGVCIADQTKRVAFSERSYVTFAALDEEEIAFYVDTFSPYDKAGAYAIQEWIGQCKVTRIEGSYTNIMGLPTERVYRTLKEWEADL